MTSRPQFSSEDDFFPRPGDADFTSFPRHISEDCVEYAIYIASSSSSANAKSDTRARLQEILTFANSLAVTTLKNYIWQHDAFAITLSPAVDSVPAHLHGRTYYADSIADEWVIVYLLREITRKFNDAWVSVSDADGEFLLIEAAEALPSWLGPENAVNRVWIHDGGLWILQLEVAVAGQAEGGKRKKGRIAQGGDESITCGQALECISTKPGRLRRDEKIEAEAFYRLRGYPGRIDESQHTARITIPRKLAYVLHQTPAHISPAVEAFYLRDPISLKPLQQRSSTGWRFPPTDLITVSTRFTRVGYAQVKSQEFAAPAAWVNVVNANDEATAHSRVDMGMKVASGFEMLMADPQSQDKRCVQEIKLLLEDIEEGEVLPSDAEVASWPSTEDDEGWLDVNFEDFEAELNGRKGATEENGTRGEFGDKDAQENLRKIVERFERFLNDDEAGVDGAAFDDETDSDEETDSEDTEEDREGSFNEEELANAMREMMGLPREAAIEPHGMPTSGQGRIEELDASDEENDSEAIKEIMQHMEAELKASGALNLDAPTKARLGGAGSDGIHSDQRVHELGDDEDDCDGTANYELAKNLLESFKGQAGTAGPAGNLMNLMGVKMPRDAGTE